MKRINILNFGLVVLFVVLALEAPSKENSVPKIRRRSQILLEEERVYASNIEHGEKRYVEDLKKEDVEYGRRRGTKKRYAGAESEEDFFEYERKALSKFVSLEREVDRIKFADAKFAKIEMEDDITKSMTDARVIEAKDSKVEYGKGKRKKMAVPKVIFEK